MFAYLAAFVSIILTLAVSDLIQGIHRCSVLGAG